MKYKQLVAALLVLSLCGCAKETVIEETVIPLSWSQAEIFLSYTTSQKTESLPSIRDLMLEASDGRIYCNVYTNGWMGNDAQLMQSVQNGSVSIVQCATSMQVAQVPEIALMDTPYLFENLDVCNELLGSELVEFFQPYYNKAGLQLISLHCPSFRQLTSTVPVTGVEDFSRVRIRVMENQYHGLFWSGLGAEVYPLAYSDLFFSLQQGVINSQENVLGATVSAGLAQVQDYVILTNHIPFITAIVMNQTLYDSLAPEDQRLISEVLHAHNSSRGGDYTLEEMQAFSFEILTPSEDFYRALKAGAEPVRQRYTEELGQSLVTAFYELVDGHFTGIHNPFRG